jgi:nitroreductase
VGKVTFDGQRTANDRATAGPHAPLTGRAGRSRMLGAGSRTDEEADVETWDAIRSRRNVRAFAERPIAGEDLDRILEAARRTPSSSNRQAWDFVVCTDPGQLGRLATVWEYARHVAGSAATVCLVAPDPAGGYERDSVQYDLGQATMSIMLAAADLGIGSGHAKVSDYGRAAEILGLPPDRVCWWLVALGYPADRPLAPIGRPNRRPFDDVVHRSRW